jgi:hypothetical protein
MTFSLDKTNAQTLKQCSYFKCMEFLSFFLTQSDVKIHKTIFIYFSVKAETHKTHARRKKTWVRDTYNLFVDEKCTHLPDISERNYVYSRNLSMSFYVLKPRST